MMTQKETGWIFGVGAVLMLIFTFTDLTISMKLYQPNMFGYILEACGEIPFVFAAAFAGALLFRFRSRKNRIVNILLAIAYGYLTLSLTAMGGLMAFKYLSEHIGITAGYISALIVVGTFLVLSFLLVTKIPQEKRRTAIAFAVTALVYFLLTLIVINVIKGYWGRLRMREMVDPLTQFTPWYIITMQEGFQNIRASFPSGHAANSTGILLFTLFPALFPQLTGKAEKAIKITCVVWITVVCISRVMMGAHFATDVTMGVLLSLSLFCFVKWRCFDWISKSQNKAVDFVS